jgi:type II secretory pathway component GspD/PulD (secretin)
VNDSNAGARGAGAWRRARLRHVALSLGIWAAFVCGPSQAQQEYLYSASYRDADIRLVAEQVQRAIGRPIVMDPRVRAQVTILSNAPMTADAFYETFLAALEVHGFVARESGNTILIVPAQTTQSQSIQENRE